MNLAPDVFVRIRSGPSPLDDDDSPICIYLHVSLRVVRLRNRGTRPFWNIPPSPFCFFSRLGNNIGTVMLVIDNKTYMVCMGLVFF